MGGLRGRFEAMLGGADIRLGGGRPWDLRVNDGRLFRRAAVHGLVGLGDAYVDGWWDCDRLDELFARALRADLGRYFRLGPGVLLAWARARLMNLQRVGPARRNAERHYNLGLDLFRAMLDRRMTYSCGYWRGARTLDEAQEAKLDLVCRKIGLRPGQSVLDIGFGWGSLAGYAAERYGARVTGITVSSDQAEEARRRCAGLDVEIRLQDYRGVRGRFDHVVSIGMFEHVGAKNHGAYMRAAARCLAPDGLFLLHTFGTRRSHPDVRDSEVRWVEKRVFPGMAVPSAGQIGRALDGVFVVEDVENFGADYDPTLMAWHENFERAWPDLREKYGERFRRLWRYYLLQCAGAFRSRKYQVWQFVLSPSGVPGGYRSVRETAPRSVAEIKPAQAVAAD
jgi:cyclopropane-fatty-acyl-phospholipid synthase